MPQKSEQPKSNKIMLSFKKKQKLLHEAYLKWMVSEKDWMMTENWTYKSFSLA